MRAWLRRSLGPADLEDVIQESYCRISALDDVDHIRSGRAYFFTTARSLVIERVRRSRIVSIEAVADLDIYCNASDEPSPERIVGGRRELARVMSLIEALPERCREVVRLRKIEDMPQRQVAERLGIAEHAVENDVAKGLRLILRALAESEPAGEGSGIELERHGKDRNSRSD
ncbi:RNA polymerase sigma factor [Sphingorhabdus contaminans]|uniref:RNA polymerase sigma factor n=1 Tax=Sphingorhabdus contaminans TaxID=1343899 RepID=UPI001B85B3B7|nr:sigma-70 family RNA polymerase sigma factor [Sphingorhabdus contaminans]